MGLMGRRKATRSRTAPNALGHGDAAGVLNLSGEDPGSLAPPAGAPPAGALPAGAPEPEIRSSRDVMAWTMAGLGLFFAIYSAWWVLRLGDAALVSRFTGATAVPAGVILTLIAIRLRGTTRLDYRTRVAWSIITVALMGYGLGALMHFALGTFSFLNVAWPAGLLLEFMTYPLIATALVILPKAARTTYDVVLFSLDVSIVAWSGAMIIWHFFIYPVARGAGQDLLASFGASLFPVMDLALVFSIGAIVIRGLRHSTRVALSVAGIALLFVFSGDMIADTEQLRGVYTPGGASGWLYSIAWLALALGAYLQWRVPDRGRPIRGLADYARSVPWIPYIAVAAAFILPAIRDWNDPDMLRIHVPATGLLMALVVARLGATSRQNASLAAAERGRLAAAVDQAAEAILTTDRAGHVTYVNLAFTRITGYAATEIVGNSPDVLRQHLDRAVLEELMSALVRGESWAGRLILRRLDGTSIDVDMAVSPLRDANGAIEGSVAVARDISRERALEGQLSQAQRMEAVGRLAGGIAHDFNNILTAISGFGELAAGELPADHPVASDINQILAASDRAAALTRALLAFSRRQVMQPRPVDLNHVLDGLTPMLGRLIGEDVQLIVRLEPQLGLAMADRAQVEQVVLNLAVNARDAMPEGGTLTIATKNEDVDIAYARAHVGAVPGPYVALVVSDTGVGMTPEVMEHAFAPFFTTKARGKGTGLGLSTAIGIVQQSGGFVDVQSELEVGSVFTIHLPRSESAARPDETLYSTSTPLGGKETILVAEDEEAVRTFVERVLMRAGYRVLTATAGAEALAIAKRNPDLDLLFTDVVMPGMSGVQLAASLTAIHPNLPVIYASGYSEEGVLRGLGDSHVPYISKPFASSVLLARVREVLDRAAREGGRPTEEATAPEPPAAPEPPIVDVG